MNLAQQFAESIQCCTKSISSLGLETALHVFLCKVERGRDPLMSVSDEQSESGVDSRACCREVKIPNHYGGVILWCLFRCASISWIYVGDSFMFLRF